MKSLYDKLINYKKENYYPMHMPGHKRRTDLLEMENAYGIDITEIEGFDNLHDANGILKSCQEKAAALYGAKKSFMLVNGSTVGLLSAISACVKRKGKIIMARNCHKSVYDAIYLNQLEPIYIYPDYSIGGIAGGISADKVEMLLEKNNDVLMVVVTSPTYEGIVSDIYKISKVTKKYKIPLLVDEAHGAHFGFSEKFPVGALTKGADIVIHSLHKTMPSLTQTALLHIGHSLNEEYIDKIIKYLDIYQTSSPSYILMASIDRCISLIREEGKQLFCEYEKRLGRFKNSIDNLRYIRIMDLYMLDKKVVFDYDISKIVIFLDNKEYGANFLYNILLEKYKIQMEMVSKDYILGMTGIFDSDEGFNRLEKALLEIDDMIRTFVINSDNNSVKIYSKLTDCNKDGDINQNMWEADMAMPPYKAYDYKFQKINFELSEGKICRGYIYLYPPGVPVLVPGEIISKEVVNYIINCRLAGISIKGLSQDGFIDVVSGC